MNNPIKNRPLFFAVIFLVFGIVFGWNYKIDFSSFFWLHLGLIVLVLLICNKFAQIKISSIVFATVLFCVGFFLTIIKINSFEQPVLSIEQESQEKEKPQSQQISGTVSSYPINIEGTTRFTLNNCKVDGKIISGKIQIYFENPADKAEENLDLQFGDIVSMNAKIKKPESPKNPYATDQRATYWSKNVRFYASPKEIIIYAQKQTVLSTIFSIRKRMEKVLETALDKKSFGAIKGMLFGDTSQMAGEEIDIFRSTGISHILAVSGLHVGLVATAIAFLLKKICKKKILEIIIIYFILVLYSAMTGFSPSVVRASIMIIIAYFGTFIGEKNDPLTTTSFAAACLLLQNPLTLFSLSFILSFSAVLGIVLFYQNIRNVINKVFRPVEKPVFKHEKLFNFVKKFIVEVAAVSLSAQIGIMPAQLCFFGVIPLVSVIVNVIIAPFVSVSVITGFAVAIVGCFFGGAAKLIGVVCENSTKVMMVVAKTFSSAPQLIIGVVGIFPIIIILIALYMTSKYKPKANKVVLLFCGIILAICFAVNMFSNQGLEAVFLDVGQGDAAFISQGGVNVLVDGGNRQNKVDYGKIVLAPFLRKKGITKIDAIIISHPHADHCGGLLEVCKKFEVKTIIVGDESKADEQYKELMVYANKNNIKIQKVFAQDNIKIKNIKIEIVGPTKANKDQNEMSLLFNLVYNNKKIMFTGDAGFAEESDSLQLLSDVDVLKVAHHGSKNSTSQEFLEKTKPEIAIISVGANNTYGHPTPQTIQRLLTAKTDVFRTDESSAIIIKIKKDKIFVSTMK